MPCHALFLSHWLGNLARGLHIGLGADGSHDLGPGGAVVIVVGMVGMACGRHGSFAGPGQRKLNSIKNDQKGSRPKRLQSGDTDDRGWGVGGGLKNNNIIK